MIDKNFFIKKREEEVNNDIEYINKLMKKTKKIVSDNINELSFFYKKFKNQPLIYRKIERYIISLKQINQNVLSSKLYLHYYDKSIDEKLFDDKFSNKDLRNVTKQNKKFKKNN